MPLGGTFEELTSLIGGDNGVDIEVEGIVDVLVGGAESDSDGLKDSPDAKELERVAPRRSARTTHIWEKWPARASRARARASRSIFERDSARHSIVLVNA